MTGCPAPGDPAGACGKCCDPVILSYPLESVTAFATANVGDLPSPDTDEGWARWLAVGWTEEDRGEARRRMSPDGTTRANGDFMQAHWTVIEHRDPGGDDEHWRIRCDAFDQHRRVCTAYEDRPPICTGFPWYGGEPAEGEDRLSNVCAYQDDVPGRTVLPIVAVRHGARTTGP